MKKNRTWSRFVYSALAASLMVTAVPVAAGAEPVSVTQTATEKKVEEYPSEVLQEAKVSREKAIEIAKMVGGNLEGFEEPNVSRRSGLRGPYENENVWEIRWMKPGPQFSHIEVAVDADTGVIRRYYRQIEGEQEVKLPPRVKYEEAVKIAEEFVKKTYGEKVGNLQLDPREGEEYGKVIRSPQDSYEVRFVQKVNGVPFAGNQLSVQVDGEGKIRQLYYNTMSNVKFADMQGVLSQEEIRERLAKALDMKLAYQIEGYYPGPGPQGEQPKVYVSYQPSPSFYMLDAKTGGPIDYRGKSLAEDQELTKLAETKQAEPPQKRAKPLTEEEALKKLKQFMKIPEEVTVSSVHLEEQMGRKTWQFHFEYQTPTHGTGWQGGMIDAETGELLQMDIAHYVREKYSQNRGDKEAEKKTFPVSKEQAQQKALALVKEQSKDKLHQLYLSPVLQEEPSEFSPFYRFNLERRIGGILVPFHQVAVAVSAETGEVVEYRQNWDWNLELPTVGEVVEPDQAKEVFLKDLKLILEYQVINEKDMYRYGRPLPSDEPVNARLVYRVQMNYQEPMYLDAASGKMLSLKTGKEVAPENKEQGIQDIKGHWAEKEMAYLFETGVLKAKDGKVEPDAQISRGEFMDLFLGVIDGNYRRYYYPGQNKRNPSFTDVPAIHDYAVAIEWAVERGLLKKGGEFRPDEMMTREQAASFIVQALGYAKLAENEAMFKLDYADIGDIGEKGEVAIVTGIGIMNGYGDKFHPDQALTRAQSAVTLFKFLEKRMDYRPNVRF